MNKLEYESLNETVYHHKLDNGLNIFLLPKKGFSKTYVTFSTNLGSLQTHIKKGDEIIELPQGIAHFLEHKLFEQDGLDISTQFALNQASVNAYTQNNRTTYLFSCTDKLYENIGLLLDFVQNPKFTDEGIKKEVSIITQEIKMYKDDPNSAIYQETLKSLYKSHPVKNEILGSVESISTITKDILTKTHQTFYHPSNMVLFVTGNIVPEDVLDFVQNNQKDVFKEKTYTKTEVPTSGLAINTKEKVLEKEVLVSNFILGIKLKPCEDHSNLQKRELATGVLIDLLLGKSTENYKQLLAKGLINDSFGMDITLSNDYAYFMIGSETNKPKELEKEIRSILLNMKSLVISDEQFLKTKKQTIGGFIQALNSLEYIANNFIKYYYQGTSLFNILEVSKSITKDDLYKLMDHFIDESKYVTTTVIPKKK